MTYIIIAIALIVYGVYRFFKNVGGDIDMAELDKNQEMWETTNKRENAKDENL